MEQRFKIVIVIYLSRWAAIKGPQKILGQIDEVASHYLEEEERFSKIQQVNQYGFEEQLEALQVS